MQVVRHSISRSLGTSLFLGAGAGLALINSTPIIRADTEKKSIYDDDEKPPVPKSAPPIVIKQPPSVLEDYVRQGREALQTAINFVNVHIDVLEGKYSELQTVASDTGKEIRANAESEEVLPGVMYVGVAILAGTIFARKRTFLLRSVLSPAVFGVAAACYFMPITTGNTGRLIYRIEKAQVPQVAEYQDLTVAKVKEATSYFGNSYKTVYGAAEKGVKYVREQAQNYTGLLFDEAEKTKKK
ncbi:apolipo protein O-domain-containing protein [Lipomyces arxii]|uniref:apolipo protein O-domain-containing protein n=1 Tax=Lipomyces arxii TaxID=56418 RepID=UPI0034CEA5F3